MRKPPSGTLVGESIAASGIGIRVSYLDHSDVPFERHETLRLSFGRSRLTHAYRFQALFSYTHGVTEDRGLRS